MDKNCFKLYTRINVVIILDKKIISLFKYCNLEFNL